jgi:hypothetical protein
MAQEKGVKELVADFEIPYLVHFTRTEHLPSIMQHGIYPVSRLNEINASPTVNDLYRFDGHLNAVSVSIAHPNNLMFYKCRKLDETVSWSIMILNPCLLWQKTCAFCRYNAADNRIRMQDLAQLQSSTSLASMYEDGDGTLMPTRETQSLKKYDPTDVQAEVLIFDTIDPKYIHAVVFDSKASKEENLELIGERKAVVHSNRGLFSTRTYARRGGM